MALAQRISRSVTALVKRKTSSIQPSVQRIQPLHKSVNLTPKSVNNQSRRCHHVKNFNSIVKPIEKFVKSPLSNFKVSSNEEVVSLIFEEGTLDFPSAWLRDNCRCAACYDTIANSRIISQLQFRPDSVPTTLEVVGDNLKITWDDGHKTEFTKEFLCQHSFEAVHQHDREQFFHEERVPWDSKKFNEFFKKFPYDKVMSDDETLLEWLLSLARNGISVVEGAPLRDGIVEKLAQRIAFVRRTLYGEVFHVKSQPGATNTAYKQGTLQMHSDMPFYHYLPGTILLHCMVQSIIGGENLLVDGINAAKQLTPEEYRILSETVVNWSDIGKDNNFQFHSLNREPVICEDNLGNIRKVNWSQPQRDSRFDVSVPEAIEWYKAMKRYSTLLHDPQNAISFKMAPGDILTLDNRRVMHSRQDYSDGARQLNGVYIDWDEIYPKIRVLRKKLNKLD